MNEKCSLSIPESLLDTSDFYNNSWLTGGALPQNPTVILE